METIKINFKRPCKKEVDLIVNFLNRGQIIVYPTDTIYGLGCLATDRKAIRRIFKIKRREKRKPLLVLVDSLKMVKKYCYVSKEQEKYLRKIWPIKTLSVFKGHRVSRARPVSVILKSRKKLPKELTGGKDGVAARLPKNNFLIKIIKKIGVPLVATSVNVSGEKNLYNVSNIEKYFKKHKPDLAADAGELKGKPSRLIDLRNIDRIKIVR